MSNISQIFAIRPTGTTDKVSLEPVWKGGDVATLAPGYTSIVSLRVGDTSYLCAYNRTTEVTDLYQVNDTDPWVQLVESRIDLQGGPWDSVTTFVLGGDCYLLTYRAGDGTFSFFRLAQDLSTSPPYTFAFARNTPTLGFTEIAPVSSLGAQYVLGYNFEDGTVAAFSVAVTTGAPGAIPPLVALNVWYHKWAKGWTRFAFFKLGGANFFFKINTKKLNVNIDHLQDNPASGTVEVGSFLQSQLPDALSINNAAIIPWNYGDPYLLTYIASSGSTAIYRIHGDCLGWTKVAAGATIAGASIVVAYSVGDSSYALFYGAGE